MPMAFSLKRIRMRNMNRKPLALAFRLMKLRKAVNVGKRIVLRSIVSAIKVELAVGPFANARIVIIPLSLLATKVCPTFK